MRFFKTKEWPIFDLGALKTSTACFALILGAYFPEVIKQYLIFFVVLGFLCWAHVVYFYFFKKS